MPSRKHLRRLDTLFDRYDPPLYFLTFCVKGRATVLANDQVGSVLVTAWQDAREVHGWLVGQYVVMPDHVHFFATPLGDIAKEMSQFMGSWKRWTCKAIRDLGYKEFNWQAEFFDHVVRNTESYGAKWEYVRANPVRAGLVARAEEWPFQGQIYPLKW